MLIKLIDLYRVEYDNRAAFLFASQMILSFTPAKEGTPPSSIMQPERVLEKRGMYTDSQRNVSAARMKYMQEMDLTVWKLSCRILGMI